MQDGQQNNRRRAKHKPDLLLMDIRMPDVDGFEVLGKIAAEEMPRRCLHHRIRSICDRAFQAHAMGLSAEALRERTSPIRRSSERGSNCLKSHNHNLTTRLLDLIAQKDEPKPEPPAG